MFRTMRRFKQQLSEQECREILQSGKRGVLAVLGDDAYPYAVPLNFVYHDNKIFFHSAVEGHKLDALAAHPKASFCVLSEGMQEPDSWWYHFDSVIVFGQVRRLSDKGEMRAALRLLGNKYFPTPEDTESDIARNFARVAVLELSIEHLSGKHVREK